MSRETKPGIDYYSHDVDMRSDKKTKLLMAKHGVVGYAVFNMLLEELYREDGYFLRIDEDFNLLFCHDNNLDLNVYISILNDCIKYGLFDKELFDKFSILTSIRSQNNYCSGTERRKKVNFIKEYILIDVLPKYNKKYTTVTISLLNVHIEEENVNNNEENVNAGTQSKVKESKVKESKVTDESENDPNEDSGIEVPDRKILLLEKLRDGMIRIDQYLLEYPEPDLEKDAVEVIGCMRKAKNPNSKLPPERREIDLLIEHWLFPDNRYFLTKDDLLKMIQGAVKKDFEKELLNVKYLLNPDHKSKLLQLEESDIKNSTMYSNPLYEMPEEFK